MSRRVLKWSIPIDDQPHKIRSGFVHFGQQGRLYDEMQVWTLTDDSNARTMSVQIFGTGQTIPDRATYLGTSFMADGALVWHLFDVTEVQNGS